MTISVVVIAYNIEKYISACILSLVNQTMQPGEIILVDDGSTDHTADICNEFAGKYEYIHVIHKENGGQSSARRVGVHAAKGEYIFFVDGDDQVVSNAIEEYEKTISSFHPEMILNNCERKFLDGSCKEMRGSLNKGLYSGANLKDLYNNILYSENQLGVWGIIGMVWAGVFKKTLIESHIDEVSDHIRIAEDTGVKFACLVNADSIVAIDDILYTYIEREDSIMSGNRDTYLSDINSVYSYMLKSIKGHREGQLLKLQVDRWFLYNVIIDVSTKIDWPLHISKYRLGDIYFDMEKGARVVIYGAGNVGRSVYHQLYREKNLEIVAWVDGHPEKYGNMGVVAMNQIDEPYDYVVIAVLHEKTASQIKEELMEIYNVPSKKIKWYKPELSLVF